METLGYKPKLVRQSVPIVSGGLELDLSRLETVRKSKCKKSGLKCKGYERKIRSRPFL